jgi:hypothetical protein
MIMHFPRFPHGFEETSRFSIERMNGKMPGLKQLITQIVIPLFDWNLPGKEAYDRDDDHSEYDD